MRSQLLTNYKGKSLSFVANNITCLQEVDNAILDGSEETYLFVVGSDEPFTCSESYDTMRIKLDDCLEE